MLNCSRFSWLVQAKKIGLWPFLVRKGSFLQGSQHDWGHPPQAQASIGAEDVSAKQKRLFF